MKKLMTSLIVAATAFTAISGAASAQQSFWDGEIDPWGRVMYDNNGDVHYTDPWASDSMVDIDGNVIYLEEGQFDPGFGAGDFQELHTQDPTSNWNTYEPYTTPDLPYANPADSHEAFINGIYE